MLAQLSTVKSRLNIMDTIDDAALTRVIKAVSAQFDRLCNRHLGRMPEAIEEFSAEETEIRVGCYPIESVASFEIKTSEADGWNEISPSPEFLVRRSCVISLHARLGTWRQRARVIYSGGYVLPGDEVKFGQIPLPDDIQQACVEQVAQWYQNRNNLGIVSVTTASGVTTRMAQQDLLPSVRSALKPYMRWLV